MEIQLLIATGDCDYSEHLSNILAEYHADAIDVSVSSEPENLRELLAARKFDVALLDESMIEGADLDSINLPLMLWAECDGAAEGSAELKKVRKYQRISSMVSDILEIYSKELKNERGLYSKKARITAVWSPVGGVGKTTAAIAYSAGRAAEGKQVIYLDLEPFSSVHAYFAETGRSISAIFEMLETGEGNIKMLIRSIRQQDDSSDVMYFSRPENFDDMNILNAENIAELLDACSEVADELVVDMSCACDERTQTVFELADRIFLVTDASHTAQIKYSQFVSQHNIFRNIREKAALVANKGAVISDPLVDEVIHLPAVQSPDAATVFSTLSGVSFGT